MKFIMLAVRDSASDLFARPMFLPAVGAGVRSFADEINRDDVENALNRHPEHFDLYKIGTFEDSDGSVVGHVPEHIVAARDLVRKDEVPAGLRQVK